MGLGRQASADMSVGLVQLAADQASFNNLNSAEVLEKFRAGLVGEVEPLRALGINLTAAGVQAKAMEMGLADANGEISQAAMVQARYALILEQSSNVVGDFQRTSDGLANSTRIAQAQFENAAASLGQSLLPMVTQAVKGAAGLAESFAKLDPGIQATVVGFGAVAAGAGPMLMGVGKAVSVYNTLTVSLKAANISMGTFALTAGAVTAAVVAVGIAVAKANELNNKITTSTAEVNDKWKEFFDTQIKDGKSAQEVMEAYRAKQEEVNEIAKEYGLISQLLVSSQDGVTSSTENLYTALAQAAQTSDEYLMILIDQVSETGYLTAAERDHAMAIFEKVKAQESAAATMEYQTQAYALYRAGVDFATTATWQNNDAIEAAANRQRELETVSVALAAGLAGDFKTAYENYTEAVHSGNVSQEIAAAKLDETNKQLLFQKVAADMDAEAARNLALHWGLLSESDYNVALATEAATAAFDKNKDGLISADEAAGGFYGAMNDLNGMLEDGALTTKELNDWLDKINGKTVTAYANVVTTNPGAGRQSGGVGGGSGSSESAKPGPIMNATGGDWTVNRPTLFMAGEAGIPERAIFIPDNGREPNLGGGDVINVYGEFRGDSPRRLSDELRLMELLK
jgi:hypothetical protein